VREVTKTYGSLLALNHVNIEVEKGEFVAIMGPSGSGKTTLLNLIGALDRPTEGDILIRGRNVAEIRDLDRFRSEEVGFVFQFQNLIPTLTALENVEVPLHESGPERSDRRERALEQLAAVGLKEKRSQRPAQLSGGERQRVAVARALVNEPVMVLADEPTGELDSATGLQIVGLMKRINRETGRTFIAVTHDPMVARMTDRILFLEDGAIGREESVRSPLLQDILAFMNSPLGLRILRNEAIDDEHLEALDIFRNGRLGKHGSALRQILLDVQEYTG
jgi:ABC-type lipoprotein export system ATPase subunit